MSTMLDLVGSFVIGGMLLLMILTAQSNLVESSYQRTMDLIAQENIATFIELFQYDFRKMGFGVPDSAVQAADSTSVTFLADLNADGSVDTVSYSVSDTSAANGTDGENLYQSGQ